MQQMRLIMMCCRMSVKRMGMLEVRWRKKKALTLMMEIVSLICIGR